jgi:uncharacterized repeat protein (TIGR01451 family)
MFDKLLSNLPFNPGLVDQVAFYARRMRREQAIRRLGFSFIAIAFIIQFIAVISPPQSSMAASNNDLINGGISSAAQAYNYCQNNIGGYGDILQNYGISCSDVAHAPTQNLSSNDYNRQLFSMGRIDYPISGETPVNVKGSTYYFRYLWGWDTGGASNYQALRVTSSITGKTFFILYNCGNLVSIGLPAAYVPKPTPCPYNANIPITDAMCKQHCALNSALFADDARCKVCPYDSKYLVGDGHCHTPLCALDSNILASDARCKACPYHSIWLKTDSRCVQCPNPNHPGILNTDAACVPVCQYNSAIDKTNKLCQPPCPYNSKIFKTDANCQPPCTYNPSILINSPSCKPCAQSQTIEDKTSCLVLSKTVSNITQHKADANGTTANAGDTLTYTLTVKNTGKVTVPKFVIQENISDVLDYATVVDLHGGTLNSTTNMVAYAAQDIKAGVTATEQITVKVKDPIPTTPVSSSDPGHFDMTMTNVYGNTTNIKLPPTVVSTTQQAVTTLPNTGPGTGLFISFGVALVAGYFLARSRLLAKEAEIVVETQVQGAMA